MGQLIGGSGPEDGRDLLIALFRSLLGIIFILGPGLTFTCKGTHQMAQVLLFSNSMVPRSFSPISVDMGAVVYAQKKLPPVIQAGVFPLSGD